MNTTTPVIAMDEVESSQIHSIGFDEASSTLAVRFKSRASGDPTSLYHYADVPREEFDAFLAAESKGKYFGKFIKPFPQKYPYVCIEKKPAPSSEAAHE